MTPQVVHSVDSCVACTCCASLSRFLLKALFQRHQETEICLYQGCPRQNRQRKAQLLW